MPKIHVLPHQSLCPNGATFEAEQGVGLCDIMQTHGIPIEHACEKSGVCSTCHIWIRQGFSTLPPADEDEEDQLGRAWGLEACSRLSCQARLGKDDVVVEIPRYTLNHAGERQGSHA
jgi:2Fe-2S ferredoxin